MIGTLEWTLLDGEHALLVKGDMRRARERFGHAYAQAEQRGEADALARAALGLGGMWVHEHRTAAAAATVRVRQRDALARLDAGSPLALRLRIRLAAEDDYRTGGQDAIMALVSEARAAGDPVTLAEALSLAHHCVLGPDDGPRRMELARELVGVASRTGRRSDLLIGLLWRAVDLLMEADPHAERALGELRSTLDGEGQQAIESVAGAIEVMLSTRGGRFAHAEERAAAGYERGLAAGDPEAPGRYVRQLAALRWYQGRIGEFVPLLTDLLNSPVLPAMDDSPYAGLAVAAAVAGDRRLAECMLARLRRGVLADGPRTSTWLVSMYAVVEAADLLGDAELAGRAAALLAPYGALPVMTSPGIVCLGSVRHSLGVAAITTGDPGLAVAHLRRAVHENLALGHWPAVALSRSRLGQALALRDGPRDEGAQAARAGRAGGGDARHARARSRGRAGHLPPGGPAVAGGAGRADRVRGPLRGHAAPGGAAGQPGQGDPGRGPGRGIAGPRARAGTGAAGAGRAGGDGVPEPARAARHRDRGAGGRSPAPAGAGTAGRA
ncbi:hypothetical protein ACFQQB_01725 [Nonomuraea rubra]|uniref:hypothetical protein n=1 Tax=Nonomuraea rubra TaxID=46180 RepID=UPI003621E257